MKRLFTLLLAVILVVSCRKHPKIKSAIEQDQVRPTAEWLQNESVRLLRDYVRINTDSRGPGEIDGALFLQRFFDCAGIPTELVCPAPRRCNLLARVAGRRREGALLLLNHIDVAPVFAAYWQFAKPFSADIRIGYLYGRGSYDMKSIALAQAIALRRLKEAGITPETDILFLGEADEEFEQKWGSKWLLENRPEWFRGVAAVFNEGGANELVLRSLRFWGIETMQAGYGFFEFEAGNGGPLNAIEEKFPKLHGASVPPDPQVALGFGLLANHLPFPFTNWLRDLDGVRRDPAILAKLPDRYGAFLEPRIHWSGVYAFPPGQDKVFHSYAVLSVPPGVDPEAFMGPIEAEARKIPGLKIHERLVSPPTVVSPYPTAATEIVRRISEAAQPGIPFGPDPGFGGMTTSVYFRAHGFPTYGYSPILMNIADSAHRHANDERVFLRDYLNGLDLYDQIVKEYAFFPDNKTSRPVAPK
jgi:acetylornithine deacetylase/succinyl-diaminopimelate desuccinylase-like protein